MFQHEKLLYTTGVISASALRAPAMTLELLDSTLNEKIYLQSQSQLKRREEQHGKFYTEISFFRLKRKDPDLWKTGSETGAKILETIFIIFPSMFCSTMENVHWTQHLVLFIHLECWCELLSLTDVEMSSLQYHGSRWHHTCGAQSINTIKDLKLNKLTEIFIFDINKTWQHTQKQSRRIKSKKNKKTHLHTIMLLM